MTKNLTKQSIFKHSNYLPAIDGADQKWRLSGEFTFLLDCRFQLFEKFWVLNSLEVASCMLRTSPVVVNPSVGVFLTIVALLAKRPVSLRRLKVYIGIWLVNISIPN